MNQLRSKSGPAGVATPHAMRRATVLIADDHLILADGLVSLLRDHFDVVGTAADGQARRATAPV